MRVRSDGVRVRPDAGHRVTLQGAEHLPSSNAQKDLMPRPRPRFPVIKPKQSHYPTRSLCPWCRKRKVFEPHSFAVLVGGACLKQPRSKVSGPDRRMEGFLAFHWHGAHNLGLGGSRDTYVVVDIVRDSTAGQYDLYFCSPTCLRRFLNACVDELEDRIRATNRRTRAQPSQRR